MPLQNMSLWQKAYFELIILKCCRLRRSSKNRIEVTLVQGQFTLKEPVPGRELVTDSTFSPEWLICIAEQLLFLKCFLSSPSWVLPSPSLNPQTYIPFLSSGQCISLSGLATLKLQTLSFSKEASAVWSLFNPNIFWGPLCI